MKMYADRKEWPLESARIHLRHERDHVDDCEQVLAAEEDAVPAQALHRAIEVIGDELTDEQRARIIKIADKCPVHKTLEGNLHIHTKMVEPD